MITNNGNGQRRQAKFRRCTTCGQHNHVSNTVCYKCQSPMRKRSGQDRPPRTPARVQVDREQARADRERLESVLDLQMRARKLPEAERNYVFDPMRNWSFDRAYPEMLVAIEVEGGLRIRGVDGQRGGRHNRPEGYEEDCRKYTRAAVLGWRIVRVTVASLNDNSAVDAIETIIAEWRDLMQREIGEHAAYARSLINS